MPGHFFIVLDDGPCALSEQLVAAAGKRGLACALVVSAVVDPLELPQLGPGDLLYRVGVSDRATVAEQLLCGPGVATLYQDTMGPHRLIDTQCLFLSRHDVPVPAAVYSLPRNAVELRAAVESVGGLPVILKQPGHSLGVGVMRLDSWSALHSVVDMLRASVGDQVVLMAAIEPAVHWRVIVVAGECAAAYRNPVRPDDFRTCVVEEPEYFQIPAPPAALDAAVRATEALGLRCGGVDVLVHESGEVYVLEVNFPFYFGHPMQAANIDVAAAMVDALLSAPSDSTPVSGTSAAAPDEP
ncbi:MAG: ATP-grasp domain-containing protein [Nannocystales bacterium]